MIMLLLRELGFEFVFLKFCMFKFSIVLLSAVVFRYIFKVRYTELQSSTT